MHIGLELNKTCISKIREILFSVNNIEILSYLTSKKWILSQYIPLLDHSALAIWNCNSLWPQTIASCLKWDERMITTLDVCWVTISAYWREHGRPILMRPRSHDKGSLFINLVKLILFLLVIINLFYCFWNYALYIKRNYKCLVGVGRIHLIIIYLFRSLLIAANTTYLFNYFE